MKRRVRDLGPVLVMATLVVTIYATLHAVTLTDTERYFDPVMLGVITVAYLVAAFIILTRTSSGPWSMLGSGMLATMTGDALLYFILLSGGQQWTIPHRDELLLLIRALLFVGGPFVVIGFAQDWFQGRHQEDRQHAQQVRQGEQDRRETSQGKRKLSQDARGDQQDQREDRQTATEERQDKREVALDERNDR